MSTHKSIDRICAIAVALALLLTALFMNGKALGIQSDDTTFAYETNLFDNSQVHTINIEMEDWDGFIDTATSEEYQVCDLTIDGETYANVAIRAKGNTSLSSVAQYGNGRYSFKVEFDHYDDKTTYYGLDKLCLNNIIQDNTYMKDYLTYTLMNEFGVDSPLCSYTWITVNGEPWGLYLAVEGVEDSFLQRNYGADTGNLYKPDSMSMGGGRGNGKDFDMDEFQKEQEENSDAETSDKENSGEAADEKAADSGFDSDSEQTQAGPGGQMPGGFDMSQMPEGFDPSQMQGEMPEGFDPSQMQGEMPEGFDASQMPEGFDSSQMPVGASDASTDQESEDGSDSSASFNPGNMMGGMFGSMFGSSDVKLNYIDDDPDSYENIFNNAKTDVKKKDKERLIESLKSLSENENIEEVVDIEEVIRYFVVHNFVVNEDSYTGTMVHNYYLHEDDGQLSMIPWDYNLAFGGFKGGDATSSVNDPIDTPLSVGSNSAHGIIDWIFESEEYTERYHTYFQEFLDSFDLQSMIEETAEMIAPYVEEDPTAFCTYEEFQTGVDTMKSFCELRSQSVQGQLDGTIPTTDEGQNADSSALIDASDLDTSAMGSMSMGGGGQGGQGGQGGSMPGGFSMPPSGDGSSFTPPSGGAASGFSAPPSGEDASGFGAPPSGGDASGFSAPAGGTSESAEEHTTEGTSDAAPDMKDMPEGFDPGAMGMETGYNSSTYQMAGISIGVLALGLIFAGLFKRRK